MAPGALTVVIDCEGEAVDELRTALTAEHKPLLTFLAQWRGLTRVRRFKIGDIEIENPSAEDLELLRARMRPAVP